MLLNLVIEFLTNKRTDNLTKALKPLYSKIDKDYQITENDVKTKQVYNVPNLIAGYLAKEQDYTIIINHNYDLAQLRELQIKNANKTPKA